MENIFEKLPVRYCCIDEYGTKLYHLRIDADLCLDGRRRWTIKYTNINSLDDIQNHVQQTKDDPLFDHVCTYYSSVDFDTAFNQIIEYISEEYNIEDIVSKDVDKLNDNEFIEYCKKVHK